MRFRSHVEGATCHHAAGTRLMAQIRCRELVSTGWAPAMPGAEAATVTAWLVNGRAPVVSPTQMLKRRWVNDWLITVVSDRPRARKAITSPAATATCAIVAALRWTGHWRL